MNTRLSRTWRRQFATVLFASMYGSSANVSADGDNRWMFRFETTFGGTPNNQRLDFVAGVSGDWISVEHSDRQYPFRVPLYTSAPSQWAVFRAGNGETPDGHSTTSAAEALGGVALIVLYFGVPLYALIKGIDEAGDRAVEEALRDYEPPKPVEIPDDLVVSPQS